MPDMTMCTGKTTGVKDAIFSCPMRERCYRHRAVPAPNRQSYFALAPVKFLHTSPFCDYFWDIGDEEKYMLPLAPFIE